jgi:Ca-activated chloride channel homolog
MKSMIGFGIFLLVVGGLATLSHAQDDPFTLSVDIDMVLFNLNVVDSKGAQIPALTKGNFKVYEEGVEQEIYSFQAEGSPATVGLVMDNSGSMSPKRPYVVTAALRFLRDSNPADEVFIVNFNDTVWKGLPASVNFSHDIDQLRSSLLETTAIGKTALYDGIAAGLEHLAMGRHQRKALVILSDGGDTSSRLNLDGTLDLIRKSNATIHTIGIYDSHDADRNPDVLKKIAKSAGGEAYIPHGVNELSQVWAKIAGDLRGQYTIGYYSKNTARDGKLRKVKIVATGNDGKPLRVRTREGYTSR